MTDLEYINLSIVFALIGVHAAANAILASDCDDNQRVCDLANAAQFHCLQGRVRDLDDLDPKATRTVWPHRQDAYRAVNEALLETSRRSALRAGIRRVIAIVEDAGEAARQCAKHFNF